MDEDEVELATYAANAGFVVYDEKTDAFVTVNQQLGLREAYGEVDFPDDFVESSRVSGGAEHCLYRQVPSTSLSREMGGFELSTIPSSF